VWYVGMGSTMRRMELLAVAWVLGLIAYFGFTTERQRENHLLIAWIFLLLPALYFGIKLLLSL